MTTINTANENRSRRLSCAPVVLIALFCVMVLTGCESTYSVNNPRVSQVKLAGTQLFAGVDALTLLGIIIALAAYIGAVRLVILQQMPSKQYIKESSGNKHNLRKRRKRALMQLASLIPIDFCFLASGIPLYWCIFHDYLPLCVSGISMEQFVVWVFFIAIILLAVNHFYSWGQTLKKLKGLDEETSRTEDTPYHTI